MGRGRTGGCSLAPHGAAGGRLSQGCPAPQAVRGDSCPSHNRKGKGKQSFLRTAWSSKGAKAGELETQPASNTSELQTPTTPWRSGRRGRPEATGRRSQPRCQVRGRILPEGSGWGTLHSLYWKVLESEAWQKNSPSECKEEIKPWRRNMENSSYMLSLSLFSRGVSGERK